MTQALLAELTRLMQYDPKTGVFTRIVSSSPKAQAGAVAGNLGPRGYWHIGVLGKNYLAHRLAWLCTHGELPLIGIDHENRIRHDNRLLNLRLATVKQNAENQTKNTTNISGEKGVTWRRDTYKWQAQIEHNGRCHYLGCFIDINEASAAYKKAAAKLFTHYTRI